MIHFPCRQHGRYNRQEANVSSDTKITKQMQRNIIKDIRRQLVYINDAITNHPNDRQYMDELANQLSATALCLTTDELIAKANEKAGA